MAPVLALVTSATAAFAALVALAFPRAPAWQISAMKYTSVRMNYDLTAHADVEMELELHNPNWVPATVNNITMMMLHDDVYGREQAVGVIRIHGQFQLPRRGGRVVRSQMSVESLPVALAASLASDMRRNNGTLITRAITFMDIKVLGAKLKLEAECEQHIQGQVFPMVITKIKCSYYYKNLSVPTISGDVPPPGSLLA